MNLSSTSTALLSSLAGAVGTLDSLRPSLVGIKHALIADGFTAVPLDFPGSRDGECAYGFERDLDAIEIEVTFAEQVKVLTPNNPLSPHRFENHFAVEIIRHDPSLRTCSI
jgi:hypothetical protein